MQKGCAISFLLIVGLCVAMFFTCPTEEDHKVVLHESLAGAMNDLVDETVRKVVNDRMDEVLMLMGDDAGEDVSQMLMGMGGQSVLGNISHFSVNQMVRVDNYYLFSVGRIVLPGKSYVVSVGLFGHVFAPDKDDLSRFARRYIEDNDLLRKFLPDIDDNDLLRKYLPEF